MIAPDIISDMKEHMKDQLLKEKSTDKESSIPTKLAKGTIVDDTDSNCQKYVEITSKTKVPVDEDFLKYVDSNNINVLKCNNQIKELHTVLRDKETSHSDFKFYSDRLIRLIVEEGLNNLPYTDMNVITPGNCEYNGVKYVSGVCGVSIMRSGEAMEKGLRECCRSIRIGKILIQQAEEEKLKSSVVYAKFPNDIVHRKVLLMYPITTTGTTVNLAIDVLKEHGIEEANIILLCLFSSPNGLKSIRTKFPGVNILTSEIHSVVPSDFGQRYFGTE